jgi:uncharacterized protein (TIGR03435 family)
MASASVPGAGVMSCVRAQTSSGISPAFEVTSVKRSDPGDQGPNFKYLVGGRFSATNCPLHLLIAEAYGLNDRSARLAGGPEWARNEKFDVGATAAEGAVPIDLPMKGRQTKVRLMIQALLADRFKLEIAREPQVMPLYVMEVSKDGLKLQRSKISQEDSTDSSKTTRTPCYCLSGAPKRGLRGDAFQMSDLVAIAEFWTDRPVVDKTGVQGEFDLPPTSGWTQMDRAPIADVGTGSVVASDSLLPTFFELFRQFGLKLDLQRGLVDILVIKHVDRPSEN